MFSSVCTYFRLLELFQNFTVRRLLLQAQICMWGGGYIPSLGWLCLALEIGWGAQTCRESSELLFLHVERGQLGHKMRISSRRAQTKGEPGVDPEFAERLYVSPGLEMPLSRPKSGGEKVNLGYLQKFLYRNKWKPQEACCRDLIDELEGGALACPRERSPLRVAEWAGTWG